MAAAGADGPPGAAPTAAGPAPGTASAFVAATSSCDGVVRGELVERDGRSTLVAVRRLRWGTQVLSERPLLLVEADPDLYIRAGDADPRLAQLAEALGDSSRLAAYIAFKQLHERRQKDFLALWRNGLEEADPLAKAIYERNRLGAAAFAADRLELARLVYWPHFVLVASIFGRFGTVNADGTRAVYALCSHVRHSCRPNAAWFTLRRGFPKGRKQLHIIAIEGIPRGEEITVCEVAEPVLVLPKPERALRLFGVAGRSCQCRRCQRAGDDEAAQEDARVAQLLQQLQTLLGVRPPTDESTREALQCLKELDKLLPFSMEVKAKAKVLLASALSELSRRAAWQEDNRDGNIIRWTGLDAESEEQRLKDMKKLYETAAKDFEYLLGQDALPVLQRLEASYGPVQDQHRLLAKYAREKTAAAEAPPELQLLDPRIWGTCGREALPPGWGELFRGGGPRAA